MKLLRSLHEGVVFDTPPQTVSRYLVNKTHASHAPWRFTAQVTGMEEGRRLRIETTARTRVRWSTDEWATSTDTEALDSGIDLFVADLPTTTLPVGARIVFTFYWPESSHWEGQNFWVVVHAATSPSGSRVPVSATTA